jgi:hypothetical protein
MQEPKHLTAAELEAGLESIRESPKEEGILRLIVCRPKNGQREVLKEAHLDLFEGLVGDNWKSRGSSSTPDGSAIPEMQLNLMNARATALIAHVDERWQLAGDQLYVEMDFSLANLPTGTRLALGSAIIEVTAPPHLGCKKFKERFGSEAMKFVNSTIGRELRLRGLNARVIQPGVIRVGDVAKKL